MEKEKPLRCLSKTALTLGELWHKQQGRIPENLEDRIHLACNLADHPLPYQSRKAISNLIQTLLKQSPANHQISDIQTLLSDFEADTITIRELFAYELSAIETQEIPEDIQLHIASINQLVYEVMKGMLDGELRANALTSMDRVIDETRNEEFETAIRALLEQIEKDLQSIAHFKEVRLTHINPDPDIEEHQVHTSNTTEYALQEHTNLHFFEWKRTDYINLPVDWAHVYDPERGELRLVFKLKFGKQEFGYLEFRFEGEKIHPLVFSKCANMSAMIDTFLNARLQHEVKKLIAEKKRDILADHNFKDWTTMCTKLCTLLSKVLEKPIAFSCNLKPGEQKSWDVLVDGDKTEEDADFIGFTKEAIEQGGEFFELKIDQGKGRQRIGSIMVACNDDAQRGIVNDVLSFLEGIVMGREEARHWLSKLIGAPSADKWLANTIEQTPTPHPVVVLYSDIDDYSKTVRELSKKHPAAVGGIDEIMNRFISEAKLVIEQKYNVVVDKFVGDEIIVLIGPPYDKNGLDAFGNKDPHFNHNIDLAYDISQELQKILDDIATDVQKEYHFTLPRRLVFANGCGIVDGDPVGIYGAPEKPGAGVDYTIFGNEMNRVARVLGKADAHQFLIPYDSYMRYKDDDGSMLCPIGEPFNITTHGVGEFKVVLVEKTSKDC
ncbi:hypothetical protein GF369_00755 [Candidatus Peregrinibacteria bacterium]|nr:hypothetical protein [Candidatus Peregrinibacteria bacterium]